MCLEHLFGDFIEFVGVGRQVDEGLRPPVAVSAIVVHHSAPQGDICRLLVAGADGGVDLDSLRVGVVAVGVIDDLPGHLGNELGVRRCVRDSVRTARSSSMAR